MSDPRDADQLLRLPPHSLEAEQSLLGALLLSNEAFEKVSWLTENAFYSDRHRRLWKCFSRMIEAGRQVDVVTACAELGDDLEKAGGAEYLAGMVQNTPSTLNIGRYATLIYEKSIQRQLAQVATEIAEEALSPVTGDVGRMLDEAESRILRISEQTTRHGEGAVELKPLLSKVFERIDHLYHRNDRSGVTGLPTGFILLDQKTAGLQNGDLIILAGRPSMGKTALALNIAEYAAVDKGVPALIFSMEMSGMQLAMRLLGSVAKVDSHKMRTGRLADNEWGMVSEAMSKLHDRPIHIDESGGMTILELRSRARRVKRRNPKLGLIVVDYLQLMEAKDRRENRATDVAEISRSLKAMAKELDVPVIALSQLSRKCEERADKRPMLSDLRESGAIEQDADVVLAVYRDAVYSSELTAEEQTRAELLILKQRNGPIGTVSLAFFGQHTRFENASFEALDFTPRRAGQKRAKTFADTAA